MYPSLSHANLRVPNPSQAKLRKLIILAALAILPAAAAAQTPSTQGRWKSEFLMRDPNGATGDAEIAVHMSILRGNADSTHVLYWYHGYSQRLMLNATDTTLASHFDVRIGDVTDPDYIEDFCGGADPPGGRQNLRRGRRVCRHGRRSVRFPLRRDLRSQALW
jgi:hypothetical protein